LNTESPMMRRVRSEKLGRGIKVSIVRLRIPRKGRIRFVLIIIALAAGVKVFGTRTIKKPHSGENVRPALETAAPRRAEKSAPHRTSFLGFLKLPRLARPQKRLVLSRDDLTVFLRDHPPTLLSRRDTVVADNVRYVVHYSLDTALQRGAEKLLARYHPKYGAVVALDPGTGRVGALVSYTREGEPPLGNTLYCKSIFPAASIFKTITAAAAIERANVSPESTFALTGRRYTLYKFQLAPIVRFSEDVSLEEAYAMSINPIFGRIGVYVLGAAGLKEYMRKFGFNAPVPFDMENEMPVANDNFPDSLLSIAETASGFNCVTRISPLFGALLAASVSEKGVMPVPTLVDSISRSDSSVAYRASPQTWRTPMRESTASRLRELMARVVRTGTARSSFVYARNSACFSDVEYGGKTGSVDEDDLGKIDWFIGFARHVIDPRQRIAVGVLTVHDQYWTVHSSFVGEELFRIYFRGLQRADKIKPRRDTSAGNETQ
jgi:penicillin-binding protein A